MYTPIEWNDGDIVTAEKLNKMDNGWGVGSSQLFTETVTTELNKYNEYSATLAYSGFINSDTLIVTFNGMDYTCVRIESASGADYSFYGGFSQEPDYSEYPFYIMSNRTINVIATESAGTYTVAVSEMLTEVSSDFEKAVAVAKPSHDFEIIPGMTTFAEAETAFKNNKNMYFFIGGTTQKAVVLYVGGFQNGYRVVGITVSNTSEPYSVNLNASSWDDVLS